MNDWGQGTSNNNIGWGQGSINNDIDWGSVYADSYAGLTDIVGTTPQQIIVDAFKSRVLADGGTFEAESCLKTTLESLDLQYPPLIVTAPVISGDNYAGQTLTTTNGVFDGITPLTYTYQWYLDENPILGATSSTYVVTGNGTISCKVTATNSFGSASSTSNEIVPDQRLIFSVKTDNAGTSATNQFTIPTTGTGYLYDIETSDGQSITGLTSGTTITFPSVGTYDVFISGSFPQFYFNNGGDRLKLINLKNFGIYALGSTSQQNAFYGCSNMVISATDIGHFENVTNFRFAWSNCSSLTSFPLLDTSLGTTFFSTWNGCSSLTSFPLLDTGAGTNFYAAWYKCSSLTSFPLIDTSAGTNFGQAWRGCTSLTSFPLIDTSSGTDFNGAWNNCSSLTSFPLLDTGAGTNFSSAWNNCTSLTSFPLINTSLGTNFTFSWFGCSSLTSFPLIDTSLGTNFSYAWAYCVSLTSFPLLDTSAGTNFAYAWYGCSSLTSFPSNAFDINIASNYASSFTTTKLSTQSIDNILVSLDTSGVINGTFNQSGGGNLPSATGLTAKANLISKGWTITTN